MATARKLIVEIIGARNLRRIDGSANAYCTLDYDGQQKKTKSKIEGLSPTWGEKFDFPYGDGMDVLDINVYNERDGSTRQNGFLGRVQIKVSDVAKQGQEALQWLRLEKWSLFSHMNGELSVKVWYEDPKLPPPEADSQPKLEPAPSKKDRKTPLVNTITPAEFKVKDVVRKCRGTAVEYHHNDNPVEPMQFLYVKVVKARNLAPKGAGGLNDSYVKVAACDVSAKTQLILKDLNPEWNQVFAFPKAQLALGKFMEVSIWDASRAGPDDFLGALSFFLEEIPSRKPSESPPALLWFSLEERPGKTGVKGELMMTSWMGDMADEALQEAWKPDREIRFPTDNHRSKVYRSPNLWYLRVGVLEAQDLYTQDADKDRQPHPFVEISLGLVQTKRVIMPSVKGTNPVWKEDLMFVAAEPFEELLVVTVKDRVGPMKEEVFGVARISIGALPRRLDFRRRMSSSWFVLESTDKGCIRGRIHLQVHFEGGYHVLDESPDFSSCTRPTAEQLWKPPLGVLELGIMGANNLLPMHRINGGTGSTDAYCVAKYGQKWIRTRTITDNFNPKWNEKYTWEVYDPSTVFTLCVFDNRTLYINEVEAKAAGVKDTPIGKVRIRLSTLEINRVYTNAYPLLVVTASGFKKMGELEFSVRFSCASTVNLMRAYLQPPLPAMHYFVPILWPDLENLRIGAMNLVASRLARFEPPLRQEVVQFTLDTESNRFSMRRCKANYIRLMNVLTGIFAMHRWFDDICTWKNSVRTISVHIFFFILVWYPDLRLPIGFLYMFVIGAWNYRFRSQNLRSQDFMLSRGGEEADVDELEEEFNVMLAGSKSDLVLKRRYERLRGFAARVQNLLGTAATQGERFQSLLSWRDPRATTIFVSFCLIAAIVLYVTPSRVMALLIGFYVLRHPKFRGPLPPILHNFFARLPSLSDLIL